MAKKKIKDDEIETTPECCNADAYSMMRRAKSRMESATSLFEGAIAIATHVNPETKSEPSRQAVERLVKRLRARVHGTQPQAIAAHLHELLFVEEGFIGNSKEYHDPKNSCLPDVIESKRGLPITLSLLYKIVGEGAGLKIRGIGLPGHFVVGVETPTGLMVVDPFYEGRVLNRDEMIERSRDTCGQEIEWSEELIRPVSNRHWLTRIMQNLLHTFSSDVRLADVAAMLELEILLWPDQPHLMRDLALVLARDGKNVASRCWLQKYLATNAIDEQRRDLEDLLDVLSGKHNP